MRKTKSLELGAYDVTKVYKLNVLHAISRFIPHKMEKYAKPLWNSSGGGFHG